MAPPAPVASSTARSPSTRPTPIPSAGLIAGTRYEYLAGDGGERLELLKADPGFDARERPWFSAAREAGAAVWSEVYPLFAEDALVIAASRPVYRPGR